MPRRRCKALPAASRSPAIAPPSNAPRRLRRHCGRPAYRRIRFRPRRRRRAPAARPIASRFSCCHDDDRHWANLVKPALKIAVAGLGTVGAGTLQLLARQAELLATRAGRRIVVAAVSARDRRRDRGVDLSAARWYEDAAAMAADPEIDVVVELIGGAEGVALNVIDSALKHKKHVVTANKALMAEHGTRLAADAEKAGVALAFEAAVAGGIPVIKTLRESLAGNRLARVYGILNGTSNFILTTMRETGREFAEVLAEAQKPGYADADRRGRGCLQRGRRRRRFCRASRAGRPRRRCFPDRVIGGRRSRRYRVRPLCAGVRRPRRFAQRAARRRDGAASGRLLHPPDGRRSARRHRRCRGRASRRACVDGIDDPARPRAG